MLLCRFCRWWWATLTLWSLPDRIPSRRRRDSKSCLNTIPEQSDVAAGEVPANTGQLKHLPDGGFILVSSARATSCLQVIHTSQIPAKYFLQKFGQGLKVMVNGGFEATRFLFEHLSREWIRLSTPTIFSPQLFLFIVAVLELLNCGCYSKTVRRLWDWKWPILHTCAFFYTIRRIWKRCVLFLVHSFTTFMAEQFMGQICAAATDYNHNLMSGCVILTWCIPFKRYIPFLWTLVFKGASAWKLPPHICSFLW